MMAVRSKFGPIRPNQAEEVAQLLLKDVMTDFCKDYERAWDLIPETQYRVKADAKKQVLAFVNDWLTKNKDWP